MNHKTCVFLIHKWIRWILEDTIELTSEYCLFQNNIDKLLSIRWDWVNADDGGHLLSIIIDSEIFIFAPVCLNLSLSRNKLRGGHACQPTLMTTIGEVPMPTQQQEPCWRYSSITASRGGSSRRCFVKQAAWLRDGLSLIDAKTELQLFN
ncbi:unnamed protein product [Schistosoma intercalatum]|nr:unnamed protein product [Schistosoma intercalatum]